MKKPLPTNTFFDINKLPTEKGLLLFGLSMSKIDHGGQSANDCLDQLRNFQPSKIAAPTVGANFIYSDFLYLYSDKPAPELKRSFMHAVINHKNSLQKLLQKNFNEFQIQEAVSYMTWSQLYIGSLDFNHKLDKIKKIYENDLLFQEYIQDDCAKFAQDMKENQINFLLEEVLMFYLLLKNQIRLPNDFIKHQQKWILFCYPGPPLKSTVHMFQLNPFDLDWIENMYQNSWYDLSAKKLYDFTRIDLKTWNYE